MHVENTIFKQNTVNHKISDIKKTVPAQIIPIDSDTHNSRINLSTGL